jgi:hypothetical protein
VDAGLLIRLGITFENRIRVACQSAERNARLVLMTADLGMFDTFRGMLRP